MIRPRVAISASFCAALLATVAAGRAGDTFRISCKHTSQEAFDKAMARTEHAKAEANTLFKDMSSKDPDCPILYWGIAVTAETPQEQQDAKYHAFVMLAIGDANQQEYDRILALP